MLFHQIAKLRVRECLVGNVLVGREDPWVKIGLDPGDLALDFFVEEALDVFVGGPVAQKT